MKTSVFIAFGGNLGDVHATFDSACNDLHTIGEESGRSRLYRTPPLGPDGQPDYLNAVVCIETLLPAEALLKVLQGIEIKYGRTRGERWGPRTLDLDLITFGGEINDTPELTLPHPEMHKRLFVLQPLCDIAPEWVHPILRQSAEELLDKLVASGEARLSEGVEW